MEQVYIPKQYYKVVVRCNTYNHSKYIEDTLNGFAIQQTTFPYICVLMEDFSTDGEQDTIMAWMEQECCMINVQVIDIALAKILLVSHRANINCHFAVYFHKKNLWKNFKNIREEMFFPWLEHCEYEALCEGDDYWIDPLKLQKQVDVLDANSQCSLTYHNCNDLYPDGSIKIHNKQMKDSYSSVELLKIPFQTATVMYRSKIQKNELYNRIKEIKNATYGDLSLFLCASQLGEIRGFTKVMSVYRRTATGANFILLNERLIDTINTNVQVGRIFGHEIKKNMVYASLHHLNNYLDGKYGKRTKRLTISLIATCFINFPMQTCKFILNRFFKKK